MRKFALAVLGICVVISLSAQKNLIKKLPKKVIGEINTMTYVKGDTLFTNYNNYTYTRPYKVPGYTPPVDDVLKDFYLSAIEASNADWNKFYAAMVAKYGAEKAKQFLPDTTVWSVPPQYNEPMQTHYYKHPAYSNYPVVGVSYTKIQEYINWKNEEMARVLKENNVTAYTLTFRLPTAKEMEYVLQGHLNGGLLGGKHMDYTCNFGGIVDSMGFNCKWMMGIGPHDTDNADLTAPVKWYLPNKLGLYNVRGNVAEWTSTAIQTFAPGPKGVQYIVKGGSWIDGPYYLQQQTHKLLYADSSNWNTGFRLAMDIVPVNVSKPK